MSTEYDEPVLISFEDGFWWLSSEIVSQLKSKPPLENTLFGLPIVMEDQAETGTGTVQNLQEYPDQCPHTKAAIALYGLTAKGACPTIVSRRSRRCACNKLGANGKYKATKNCCWKIA